MTIAFRRTGMGRKSYFLQGHCWPFSAYSRASALWVRPQRSPECYSKGEQAKPARASSLQLYRYGLRRLVAVLVRANPLVNTAQESNLKGSPFYRAWQQVALGNHDCPEPAAAGIVEPALGQLHALVERFPTVSSPGDLDTWVAIMRRKTGHHALAHLAPPRTSERARR